MKPQRFGSHPNGLDALREAFRDQTRLTKDEWNTAILHALGEHGGLHKRQAVEMLLERAREEETRSTDLVLFRRSPYLKPWDVIDATLWDEFGDEAKWKYRVDGVEPTRVKNLDDVVHLDHVAKLLERGATSVRVLVLAPKGITPTKKG
jgi:hypothetical protein